VILRGLLIPDAVTIVETAPAGVIFLILWLPVSATYKFPEASNVISLG
jgi:hypothetical protein